MVRELETNLDYCDTISPGSEIMRAAVHQAETWWTGMSPEHSSRTIFPIPLLTRSTPIPRYLLHPSLMSVRPYSTTWHRSTQAWGRRRTGRSSRDIREDTGCILSDRKGSKNDLIVEKARLTCMYAKALLIPSSSALFSDPDWSRVHVPSSLSRSLHVQLRSHDISCIHHL
jgi:hypothetical protein